MSNCHRIYAVILIGVVLVLPSCGDSSCGDSSCNDTSDAGVQVTEDAGLCGALANTPACDGTFLCNAPVSGKVSVCGQLIDVASNTYVRAAAANAALCDPNNPTSDGPCSLTLSVYDAVDFSTNPDTATPLSANRMEIDNCGRFRAESVDFPTQAPFVAISVRGAAGVDTWADAAAIMEVTPNLLDRDLRLYSLERSADATWTTTAGAPFSGNSFVDRGVYVPLFMSGEPDYDYSCPTMSKPKRVAGVTVTVAGEPASDSAYYFSDSDPNVLSTIDIDQTATGPNGAALVVDSDLVMTSGSGGEPAGCVWPSNLGVSIPGVALISERIAVETGTGDICQ